MDQLRDFLEAVRKQGAAGGNLRGLLHVLIGRRINQADGTLVSGGMTWRELAAVLKKHRWDREAVRELGLEPDDLPPRDREKFWYVAISQANVGSNEASAGGDELARAVKPLGYVVGGAPGSGEKG